jgi:signal transduction histidine kinase/DNA-binding response OmpR family regulator
LEDSPLDADLIIDSLQSDEGDCVVECVQTQKDFEAALKTGPFDVVLSDYSLPGFDGMTALGIAKQVRPAVPFIFVSGYLGEDLAIETLKQGATDYVLKGRLERLLPSVERAIREFKEREDRVKIENTLRILSDASLVLSSLDYSTTLSHVARLAVPHFADICLVDIVGESGQVERVAVADADSEREQMARQLLSDAPVLDNQHPSHQILKEGRSQLLSELPPHFFQDHPQNSRHMEKMRELKIEAVMMIPLLTDGQTLGVMTFLSCSPERTYQALDLSLAEDLARRCAMAVENARLHRKTLDALRARDEFLAVLSHELRSPLTSILGWVQILQEEVMDKEMLAQGLDVIERNTKVQVQLIQELLEVSRIITGRLRLEMVPVLVSEVVKNALNLMEPTAKAKGVAMNFHNQLGEVQIMGDEPRLQQIFWNLLSNALKFTPRGGSIEITLSNRDEFIYVMVRDNGEGIAPEFLPYVFDRFRQANSTSTRQHGGLGLGLAIVRHLTEMHGGSVTAQSEGLGKGATFLVRLPFRVTLPEVSEERALGQEAVPSREAQEKKSVSLEGVRVLLVEDGDDAREILKAVLQRAGAKVDAVASVKAATEALTRNVPNVMVSDIGMPDEDGYVLMQHVKEWELTHGGRIPAIALTAYAGEQDRLRAISAGFVMHLTKPVEPEILVTSVLSVLGGG